MLSACSRRAGEKPERVQRSNGELRTCNAYKIEPRGCDAYACCSSDVCCRKPQNKDTARKTAMVFAGVSSTLSDRKDFRTNRSSSAESLSEDRTSSATSSDEGSSQTCVSDNDVDDRENRREPTAADLRGGARRIADDRTTCPARCRGDDEVMITDEELTSNRESTDYSVGSTDDDEIDEERSQYGRHGGASSDDSRRDTVYRREKTAGRKFKTFSSSQQTDMTPRSKNVARAKTSDAHSRQGFPRRGPDGEAKTSKRQGDRRRRHADDTEDEDDGAAATYSANDRVPQCYTLQLSCVQCPTSHARQSSTSSTSRRRHRRDGELDELQSGLDVSKSQEFLRISRYLRGTGNV